MHSWSGETRIIDFRAYRLSILVPLIYPHFGRSVNFQTKSRTRAR